MSRATVSREWTAAERERADRIVTVIAGHPDNIVFGGLQVARGIGLKVSGDVNERRANMRLVYGVMPLAIRIAAHRFPGKALIVKQDGPHAFTYRITSDSHIVMRRQMVDVKRVRTIVERMVDQCGPLRDRADLAAVMTCKTIDELHERTSPMVWDAIMATTDAEMFAIAGD